MTTQNNEMSSLAYLMMLSRIRQGSSLTRQAGPPACSRSTGLAAMTGSRERPQQGA
jgi:hypothetical protein